MPIDQNIINGVCAVSLLTNLFLLAYGYPGKSNEVRFWREQSKRWSQRYFELLDSLYEKESEGLKSGTDSQSGKGNDA